MADATEPGTKAAAMMRVQICYALPDDAHLETLSLSTGATVAQALQASGLITRFPALAASVAEGGAKLGIFGKLKTPDTVLRDGDRIEVYRPLQADPKETRRRRAKHKQQSATGG